MSDARTGSCAFYHISRGLLKCFLKFFGRIDGVGAERVPKKGAVILAPNHVSYLDPPAVGVCIGRQVHFMAKEELFRSKFLGSWMHGIGTFPVHRGSADRKAIKQALGLLEKGRVVCIFPEGTRSPDGNLQDPELGIGLIALKSRAPVVPVFVSGTNKVLPSEGKGLHFNKVRVVYGEPLTFPDFYEAKESRQAVEEIGRRTMSAIANLKESVSGE